MFLHVLEARYIRNFVVWVRFSDGTKGEVDLSAELTGPVFGQKWLRLFEQLSPIYKWILGGSAKVQSCPRRRARGASHAHKRATRWATRGAPGYSSYAASFNRGRSAKYFSCGVSRSRLECGRCVLYQPR